jgi:PAS domain S-box-containing protein
MALPEQNGGFILLVEDDRGTSELEAQRLEPLRLEVRRAANAEETMAELQKATPELMLLDYSLPGTNAVQLIERLREGSITIPPFIVVTGRGDEGVAVETMKSGALDYIVKNADFLENLLPAAKKALEKIKLLNDLETSRMNTAKNMRLYSFLAQVNAAASLTKEKDALFRRICEIAVKTGELRMAWIAVPDRDLGRLIPLCWAGNTDGYLDSIKISLHKDDQTSKGPSATAATTGRICTTSDISTDPLMLPWRQEALKRGYRSTAALPLEEGGKTVAILQLYSAQPSFFTDDELKLLYEIKGDISLALDAISSETKRTAAEAALEHTARQLTHVMDVTPVMLLTLRHKNGVFIREWVSGNLEALTGYSPEEILSPGWWRENVNPEDSDDQAATYQKLLKEGQVSRDFRFRKKNGQYFWAHSQLKLANPETGEITGSWTDITPLKESEIRFQELFEKAPVGYQSLDADGKLLAVNNTWTTVYGYCAKEALGRNFTEFLLPGSKKVFADNFSKLKADGKLNNLEFEIRRKDGAARHIVLNGEVGHNQDGTFRQTHCVFTDVTDTWKDRRQTDLLSQAIRASFNEIYIFDAATFRFIFVNYCAVKNLGYSPEELEELTPWDLEKEFTEAAFRQKVAPLLASKGQILDFKSVHTRKDGTSYPVEIRLQLIKSDLTPIFLSVINDITEKEKSKRMAQELISMQRVESLGALAGGIAHDFNNMLTGIMGNLSLLGAKANCAPADLDLINDTIEATRNAQGLTSQLLAFSKGGRPVKKEFCLEHSLRDIFKLSTSGTRAACEFEVPDNLWSVNGDENQIKQAVGNLLINALQAMPSGGKLTLRAENSRCRDILGLKDGDCVKITVSDTGIGIPAEYLDRVFEPYFTTKAKGHGLGLSTTWSVVKNHGGHIEAKSEPGKGTTFVIYLPSTGR